MTSDRDRDRDADNIRSLEQTLALAEDSHWYYTVLGKRCRYC